MNTYLLLKLKIYIMSFPIFCDSAAPFLLQPKA